MIVLDTNVLSEVLRPFPSEVVLRWLAAQTPRSAAHSVTVCIPRHTYSTIGREV